MAEVAAVMEVVTGVEVSVAGAGEALAAVGSQELDFAAEARQEVVSGGMEVSVMVVAFVQAARASEASPALADRLLLAAPPEERLRQKELAEVSPAPAGR